MVLFVYLQVVALKTEGCCLLRLCLCYKQAWAGSKLLCLVCKVKALLIPDYCFAAKSGYHTWELLTLTLKQVNPGHICSTPNCKGSGADAQLFHVGQSAEEVRRPNKCLRVHAPGCKCSGIRKQTCALLSATN